MNVHSLLNVILLLYLLSFPIVLEVNKRKLKGKNKKFNQMIKMGRKIHPFVGVALILSGALHGYLKMGGQFVFHTGSLLLMGLMLNGILGFIYKKKKKMVLALCHRIVGFLIIGLFLLHYLKPWYFSF